MMETQEKWRRLIDYRQEVHKRVKRLPCGNQKHFKDYIFQLKMRIYMKKFDSSIPNIWEQKLSPKKLRRLIKTFIILHKNPRLNIEIWE